MTLLNCGMVLLPVLFSNIITVLAYNFSAHDSMLLFASSIAEFVQGEQQLLFFSFLFLAQLVVIALQMFLSSFFKKKLFK